MKKVAIVGAGISGAACAQQLLQRGFAVEVFEKSRGPGGRMATRRVSSEPHLGQLAFDHGAPYFRARSREFQHALKGWEERAIATSWKFTRACIDPLQNNPHRLESETVFVGSPGMNSLCKDMLANVTLHTGAEVLSFQMQNEKWMIVAKVTVQGESNNVTYGPYDHIVTTAPAPQAHKLLASHSALLAEKLLQMTYAPCWAVLAYWKQHQAGLDAWEYLHSESPLGWVGRSSAKPGRHGAGLPAGDSWVVHGSATWSQGHLESSPEEVVALLLEQALPLISPDLTPPDFAVAHRWRYSLVTRALDLPFVTDKKASLSICGDGCLGGRVESAYLSGFACGRDLPFSPD